MGELRVVVFSDAVAVNNGEEGAFHGGRVRIEFPLRDAATKDQVVQRHHRCDGETPRECPEHGALDGSHTLAESEFVVVVVVVFVRVEPRVGAVRESKRASPSCSDGSLGSVSIPCPGKYGKGVAPM